MDISAEDLKYALEGIAGTGQVNVEYLGSCRRPEWSVEWLTKPGDQPLLQVRLALLILGVTTEAFLIPSEVGEVLVMQCDVLIGAFIYSSECPLVQPLM